jgi:hypothetical protein
MTGEATNDEENPSNVFDHIAGTITGFWEAIAGAFTPEDLPPATDNLILHHEEAQVSTSSKTRDTVNLPVIKQRRIEQPKWKWP